MKKGLLYLCTLFCMIGLLSSCKDDEAEELEVPPTVEDVIAEYTADKLKATIDGVAGSDKMKVELAQSASSDKVTIKLFNVVPGVPVFEIPEAEFAVTTRSIYKSTLKGEVTDNVSGYTVKVDGTVEEEVLTVSISMTEIEGEEINTKKEGLHGLVYKGNMDITVGGIPTPSIVQRVYVASASRIGTTKRDTAMVKLTIQNFSFEGLPLGDIKIDTVLVLKRGDVLGFKAEKRELVLNGVGKVTADLYGSIVGQEMKLSLDIDASGLKVGVAFGGNAIKESQVAKITKMTVDSPAIIEQKMTTTNLTLRVWDDVADAQLSLTPVYELSEKATIDSVLLYRKGQPSIKLTNDQITGKAPIDFSLLKAGKNDFVKYWLAAEDPNVKSSFLIYVERVAGFTPVYDMQTWVADAENGFPTPKGLANSNLAAAFFPLLGINVPTPVVEAADKAAEITTSRTVSVESPSGLVPGVTPGTLFNGVFSIDIFNTLKSTHFGEIYRKEPASFKISYKYTSGAIFYKTIQKTVGNSVINDTEVMPNEIDECSINAYLYEVSSLDETLDGTNINTSNKVILKAVLENGKTQSAYVTKEIPFKSTGNGTYNPAKMYKLAIVCSSSKRGDEFMGADGSKLWVKHLEVVSK